MGQEKPNSVPQTRHTKRDVKFEGRGSARLHRGDRLLLITAADKTAPVPSFPRHLQDRLPQQEVDQWEMKFPQIGSLKFFIELTRKPAPATPTASDISRRCTWVKELFDNPANDGIWAQLVTQLSVDCTATLFPAGTGQRSTGWALYSKRAARGTGRKKGSDRSGLTP